MSAEMCIRQSQADLLRLLGHFIALPENLADVRLHFVMDGVLTVDATYYAAMEPERAKMLHAMLKELEKQAEAAP